MVFANPFEEIIELLRAMHELGIKPEHECFDLGHVGSLEPLIDMGVLKPPLHVDCIMGVVGGIPPSARNLAAMVANIPEGGGGRGFESLGRDRHLPRAVAARGRGAHPRRLGPRGPGGQPLPAERRDGPLQRRAGRQGAQMAEDVGRRPATVQEARALLNVTPSGRADMNAAEETSVGVLARILAAGVPTEVRGRRPACRRGQSGVSQ